MSDDFDAMIDETRRALDQFVRGDPEPMLSRFSRRDDVTLANPLGPPRRGRGEVDEASRSAAAHFRDGTCRYETVSKVVTSELAYILEIERFEAKLDGRDEVSAGSLRVTMIFRREGDDWKIVHRHADPITTARPVQSLMQD